MPSRRPLTTAARLQRSLRTLLTEKLKRYGNFSSHDALKLVAILAMVTDHIGYYFLPEYQTLRIVGRFAAPIFFFFIGYSSSYKLHWGLLVGAALLTIVQGFIDPSSLYLNILVSFILVRLFFQFAEKWAFLIKYPTLVLVALIIPSLWSVEWIEFGTIGPMFALAGFVQKHSPRYRFFGRFTIFFMAFWFYDFAHIIQFDLLPLSAAALSLGLLILALVLWHFRNVRIKLPKSLRKQQDFLLWPARYSLFIYVAHLALFHIITKR